MTEKERERGAGQISSPTHKKKGEPKLAQSFSQFKI